MAVQLIFTSDLSATPAQVWVWITSMNGINRELSPLMRMTAPPNLHSIDDIALTPGEPICRSWLLLFKLFPIDRSQLTLVSMNKGTGFTEESPMWTMRQWRHERWLEALPENKTRLTDRLTFAPRLTLAAPLVRVFVNTLFRHRHSVLRDHFGHMA